MTKRPELEPRYPEPPVPCRLAELPENDRDYYVECPICHKCWLKVDYHLHQHPTMKVTLKVP